MKCDARFTKRKFGGPVHAFESPNACTQGVAIRGGLIADI